MYYIKRSTIITPEADIEGENINAPSDIRTMKIMSGVSNFICTFSNFIPDTDSNQKDQKYPISDIELWAKYTLGKGIGKNTQQIYIPFYEKYVCTKKIIIEQSTMVIITKVIVLTQEAIKKLSEHFYKVPLKK